MTERVHNMVNDSDRWREFAVREGDIIISTPAKCGTTWTQMIVALLVLDTADLPESLARLSPWVDQNVRPLSSVLGDLDAETHRRFPKSHLPYELLPGDERITYISVGRDPRDVFPSIRSHFANTRFDVVMQDRAAAVGLDDLQDMPPVELPPSDRREGFRHWITHDSPSLPGLATTIRIIDSFWRRRTQPNVIVLHYADLQADLVGQMVMLSKRLGIDRTEDRIAQLAPAASLASMRANAERLAPNADQGHFVDAAKFFNRGESGRWRAVLEDEDLALYDRRMAELAAPELIDWLHKTS